MAVTGVNNKHTVSYMRKKTASNLLILAFKRGFALWSDTDKLAHKVLNINVIQNVSVDM